MIRLASPEWLLVAVLLLVWIGREVSLRDRRAAVRFSALPLFHGLPRTWVCRTWWLPRALRYGALAAWIVALARPQVPAPPEARDTEGIDVMVVLDVSTSMRAADFQPRDRMTVAKSSVAEFVQQRSSDRIGLVLFSAQALSWVPPTLDYGLLLDLMKEVEPGMLPDGTAIGTAIGTAVSHLTESPAESKVVVLLTDGENNAGNLSPRQAGELAREAGVVVHTIAIGTGGEVPYPAGRDFRGRPVYQKVRVPVDRELLQSLADQTGGRAFVAEDGQALDAGLSQILDALDRTRLESGLVDEGWQDRFAVWIWVGICLWGLEFLMGRTRWRTLP